MYIWPSKKPMKDELVEEAGVKVEDIFIDLEKSELMIGGVYCAIPKLDLAILAMLYERKGECVTREEIKHIFGRTMAMLVKR